MPRRRLVLQIVTLVTVAFIIILGNQGVKSDPAGEARSYIQSRPVFHKPSPKPKLILKPPQQLLLKDSSPPSTTPSSPSQAEDNIERVTQTVYGFLDFVTTIGNTVMVFTPQTKHVEAINVKETVAPTPTQSQVKATAHPTPPTFEEEEETREVEEAENIVPVKPSHSRQPKQLQELPKAVAIEASEVEPQEKSVVQVRPTPVVQEAPEIRTQVNVVASSPILGSGEFIEGEFPESEEAEEEIYQQLPSTTTTSTTPPPPPPQKQSKPKLSGFTLKLTPKHNSPVIVTPALVAPVVVTAQKVELPPPPQQLQPTGVLNKIYETKVNPVSGEKTVIETRIIGTYIGTEYHRVLESTSSIVANSVKKVEPTKSLSFPSLIKATILAQAQKQTTTSTTSTTIAPSNDGEHDISFGDENEAEPHLDDEDDQHEGPQDVNSATLHLEPTPTASEEQTHYILPQKPEKIYVSAVPSPNLYSRQPQLYVDANPAKNVDVVTATPSRGKQFRLSNRFGGRGSKPSSGSDSNELTLPQEVQEEASTRRSSGSRFGRGRSRSEPSSSTAISTVVVSATPSRRFKNGGGRTSSVAAVAAPAPSRAKDFNSYKTARGFNPSRQNERAAAIAPTTSTSIYRFKLNRPTGRWRFKPSPKPKVNIIKTKEEEDGETEVQVQSPTNGPVYLQAQPYEEGLQHGGEEPRTESNELTQEDPDLVPQTIRVSTITPTEFEGLDKYLEIATIKSPYVFQAGNVKNTRYITVTKTFTKEPIQPTLASSQAEASLENILATKPPYEKILEGSSDVATLPVIALGGDVATPPLETITQSFSTTQLMLKTSILPVLYDGVTTLYTLTQSYFITRLVTAHKTVPPMELFQFVPTKSLTEFNTALQEAGSEHREQLVGSESDDDGDNTYQHIILPPDELTSVGSDFDPSSMDEKIPKRPKSSKAVQVQNKDPAPALTPVNPFANPNPNSIQDPLAGLAGLTAEQVAFIRYFTAQNQQQQQQQQHQQQHQIQGLPQFHQPHPQFPQVPQLPQAPQSPFSPQLAFASSPVVVDTHATVTETKTLRLLFGSKPTHTVLYSTRVVPTRMTTYVTASLPVKPTQAIQQNPFLNALPFPLAYVG